MGLKTFRGFEEVGCCSCCSQYSHETNTFLRTLQICISNCFCVVHSSVMLNMAQPQPQAQVDTSLLGAAFLPQLGLYLPSASPAPSPATSGNNHSRSPTLITVNKLLKSEIPPPKARSRSSSRSRSRHGKSSSSCSAKRVTFRWKLGGRSVEIFGSFNNWSERLPLRKHHHSHKLTLRLRPGVHLYRFYVDGQWRVIPDQACVKESDGTENNVVHVAEGEGDPVMLLSKRLNSSIIDTVVLEQSIQVTR